MSEILERGVFLNCLLDQTEVSWEVEAEMIRCHDAALRLALETANAEVARHVRERALLMDWAIDKDGTGCDGCHGSTAGGQDLMLLCQPCGEKWRALKAAPPADAATEAVREAIEAATELLYSVRSARKGSIGSIDNTYLPQIGREWLKPIEERIEAGAKALAARGGAS